MEKMKPIKKKMKRSQHFLRRCSKKMKRIRVIFPRSQKKFAQLTQKIFISPSRACGVRKNTDFPFIIFVVRLSLDIFIH